MSEVESTETQVGDLVVVGSSAGGIEALSILVSTLQPDFPAPIVLAQHLDPSRPSALDQILQRRTKLAIEIVVSSTELHPGKIYVVPANHHVSIKDHYVEVREDRIKRPRPSIDTLLSTAAEAYGEHLFAVILTGSGSDGAVGAVDVKNAGGTVIVQDPQTARYPSMPMSLPPTVVDFQVNIDQIGPLLHNLLNGVKIPQTEEKAEDVLHEILAYIGHQVSIDFRPYKTSTILRRIGRRMTVTHTRSMRDYVDYLKIHPEEVGELVKAFLINVTQFFRDVEAFAYLKSEILPKLIARSREHDHTLRFWTAGCATGEEPYSLAILLMDILGSELSHWSIKIFATDLDEAAIAFARRGFYSENLLKGIPNEYRERFFERADQGYRISKTLRQMVIFGQQDLSRSAPFPRIDLILCRNVLIYFTPELQDYVLNQFAFSLSPNGYLFLGKAETVRSGQLFYELVNKQWKIYHCIGNAPPLVRHQARADSRMLSLESPPMNHQHHKGKQSIDQELPALSLELGQLRRFNELLLRFLPIGVAIIDRNYRILTANGAARRLLGLREGGKEQDFLHAVRGIPYHEVREAIDTVFRERSPFNLPEIDLDLSSGGNGHFISLSMSLMQLEAGVPDLVAISITDVTQQVQVRRKLERAQEEQGQLMNELSTANKRLSDVNKELMDANEELQVANEELVLTHEELQASIEEFETTNEELQATNEELETNNEELQATNEELETTNEELRARTSELQELTSILETERGRLAEMVELAPFYILALRSSALLVEAYNPRYARLLEDRVVQDRPLDEVIDLFWESGVEIVHFARDAYRLDRVLTTPRMLIYPPRGRDTQNGQKELYFTYTIVPSHDIRGKVDGVIIYAIDETQQRLREVEEERARLNLIFNNFPTAALALYDIQSTELIMASPRYLQTLANVYGLPEEKLLGRRWPELTMVPLDKAMQLWQQVIESSSPQRVSELVHPITAEHPEIIWDYTMTPIKGTHQPHTTGYILITIVEITDQVQERKEMEALNSLKDEFLSLAAHELRNPLTSIQANVQLLQRKLPRGVAKLVSEQDERASSEQDTTMLNKIVHQVNRMNTLIGEMMDVTRIRGNVFELHNQENIDLVGCVRQVVEAYATNNREIVFNTNEQVIRNTFDIHRIEQVLNNLIDNSIKYSSSDKPVIVKVERDSNNQENVLISVHDDGSGIAQEDQEHIFDRFYRTHETVNRTKDGLGLGLYIAREIITQQGGRIWVESQPGEGSTFYITLPVQSFS